MEQIIKSLLDTDAYKFSMGQAIFHQFSGDHATWTFKCRNENVRFTKDFHFLQHIYLIIQAL